jgi:hypothetical protein
MKEFQNLPMVNWFTTFDGNPITTDVTEIFSTLRRIMHECYYDEALSFSESDVDRDEPFYPKTPRDENSCIIDVTTPQFQRREAVESFFEDQRRALNMLTKSAFATLVLEGVPGSSKTTFAHLMFLACNVLLGAH